MSDDLDLDLDPSGQSEGALAGTVRLAQSALRSPPPPAGAESRSRHRVESLMQEAALSPSVLREITRQSPRRPGWQRLTFWKR